MKKSILTAHPGINVLSTVAYKLFYFGLKDTSPKKSVFLLLMLMFLFFKGNNIVYAQSLRELASVNGINIGTAVNINALSETKYKNTLKREFSMVVAENAMKMDALTSAEGVYTFTNADVMVNFAVTNGIAIRGHNFIWHSQVAQWVTTKYNNNEWTRESLLAFMKMHITTVAGHFKGKVKEWDVVNEAVADGGGGLRTSMWYSVIGADFIDSAFAYARQADPDALLFYNDYSAEDMGSKSTAVYNIVKKLKEKGLIDGVGFQSHFNTNKSLSDFTNIQKNITRLQALGLKVAITELDYGINMPAQTADYATQGNKYATLLRLALKNNIETFVIWGFTDKYSWIPGFSNNAQGDALIFDANYNTKPAYDSLVAVLTKASTTVTGTVAPNDIVSQIFPNPVKDKIYIRLEKEGDYEVTLFDIIGKVQGSWKFVSDGQIDLSVLPVGLYNVHIQQNGSVLTRKILKE